MIFQWTAALSA